MSEEEKNNNCPICGSKLKNTINFENGIIIISSYHKGHFISRICNQPGHYLRLVNKKKKNDDANSSIIDNFLCLLKVSLSSDYSHAIEIDYLKNQSVISLYKNHLPEKIIVPYVLEIDFPDLEKLKAKVNLFIAFNS